MKEEEQIRAAHRQYESQAFGKPNHRKPALAINEIWQEGDAQLTVYRKLDGGGVIPSAPYQREWQRLHPKARKVTQ